MVTEQPAPPADSAPESEAVQASQPILHTLAHLRRGQVLDLLSLEFQAVVCAVLDTGKAGEVSLKFKIKKQPKSDNLLDIQVDVNGKPPAPETPSDFMFADEHGRLHTRNPRQHDAFEGGPQGV